MPPLHQHDDMPAPGFAPSLALAAKTTEARPTRGARRGTDITSRVFAGSGAQGKLG